MADLGSQKISSNYKKLLQISGSGMVADGSGSLVTLNLSGSKYYTSGSAQVLKALTVTGSIVPEGNAKWDLGSPDYPFQHLFLSNDSLVFVESGPISIGQSRERIRLTKDDIYAWQTGDFSQRRSSTTKQRLSTPIASTIRTAGVEPFVWDENDRDLVSNDLTSLHIVSDRFWVWDSGRSELSPRSVMFRITTSATIPSDNEIVIGG